MVIITIQTETSFSIRTNSFNADTINWNDIRKIMKDESEYKYSIKVIVK